MSIGAGAIRAGLAVVTLSADLGPLDAALNTAAAHLKGWSGKLARLGAGVGGLGLGLVAPIAAAFKGAVDNASRMGTLALQLSTTAEKASELTYALGTVGIGEEELVGFTRHLNSAFAAAADGSHEAVQGFARLGLNWQELAKIPIDERLLAVTDALRKVTNDFDRSNQAAHYFGRRGQELLKLPAGELRKRMAEAHDVGAVVTQEQAAQAKEVQRSWAQIGSAIKYAFLEVGRALLPHAAQVKKYAASVVNIARTVREWVSANKPLVLGILGLGAALTAAGAALVALGVIGASVAGVLAGLGAVLGIVFSPIALKLVAFAASWALVAGAIYLVATRTQLGRSAVVKLTPALREMGAEGKRAWMTIRETAIETWGGIASAMKRGDLQSAWGILVAGAKVAWLQIKASFLSAWYSIKEAFLDIWEDVSLEKIMEAHAEFFLYVWRKAFAQLQRERGAIMAGAGLGERFYHWLAGTTPPPSQEGTGGKLKDESADRRKQRVAEAAAARAELNAAVETARAELRKLLDQEKKAAAVARARGGPGEGPGGQSLQVAAREVRGSFGATLGGSAGYQQAFAVGSTPVQRQLIDNTKETNTILRRIEGKVEGPATIG